MGYTFFPMTQEVKAYLVTDIIMTIVAIIVVGLRITSRRITGAGLGWDDWLILISFVSRQLMGRRKLENRPMDTQWTNQVLHAHA
jgi:nicotinamide riboside transporter PnuC